MQRAAYASVTLSAIIAWTSSIYFRDPNGYPLEITLRLRDVHMLDAKDAEMTLEAAIQVEDELRAKGILPPLVDGEPRYSDDPLERLSQMLNEAEIAHQLSAERLQTGYDQATQDGIPVDLVVRRSGHAPRNLVLRITLDQHADPAGGLVHDFEGMTDAEMDALANLASGGVTGGALVIVGEDYGEGSSIMQERSHAFAMKSQIWLLDPRPNLESMVKAVEDGFELSEASKTPVMLQLRIRGCHVHGRFVAKENKRPAFTLAAGLLAPAVGVFVLVEERISPPAQSSVVPVAANSSAADTNPTSANQSAKPKFERSDEPAYEDSVRAHGG